MLYALKIAYVGTLLTAAEVGLPFPILDIYLDALRSIMSPVSLQMPILKLPPAGSLTARAYGIGNDYTPAAVANKISKRSQMTDDELAQLILTVDYSDAAPTVLLVEGRNVFEYRRILHDTDPSAHSIFRTCNGSRREPPHITLPLEEGNGAGLRHSGQLVPSVERAHNRFLRRALGEIF